MASNWQKGALGAVVVGALLMTGCGQTGVQAPVQTRAGAASASSLFGKLPAARPLTEAERALDLEAYRAIAAAEVAKVAPNAKLLAVYSSGVDEKGVRTLKGAAAFYFQTGRLTGIVATVDGSKLSYSRRTLSTLKALVVDGLQPLPEHMVTAAQAIAAAKPTKQVTGPEFRVSLAQPRSYTRPIYEIQNTGWFQDDADVNAVTGQLEPGQTGKPKPKLADSVQQLVGDAGMSAAAQ
jgi:hypothetical protein